MPSITISRGTKTGGIALAQKLADRLGYRALSREILVEGAKKYGIEEEKLTAELTKPPSLWSRWRHDHRRYLVIMKCSLLQAVKRENIVYHGNAGQVLLKGVHGVLRVRIDAPLARRVEAEMQESDISREEATARILKRDDERRRWVKYLYDRDWDDASLYDLSINLATMSMDTACDVICHTVGEPEFQATNESNELLEDNCLQCEVEAALARDDVLWKHDLKVTACCGDVTVYGQLDNRSQKERLESVVSHVEGVRKKWVNVDLNE